MGNKVVLGDQEFPIEEMIVVSTPRPFSIHPEGTPELPCCVCSVACPVDGRTIALCRDHGRQVVCLRCAYHNYPDMACGVHDGKTLTLREAYDKGFLGHPGLITPTVHLDPEAGEEAADG